MSYLTDGFRQAQNQSRSQAPFPGQWEPIGPMNFGGRTLALAFNPQNPNTMFAGSASGGLWRTYSGANGAQAWHQVETGFPILGVASIAINPLDSNEIYIGTGEVYNDQQAGTGFAVRTTRGTYGIGLLKSSDGGQTWTKSIDWQYDELKGVQDIVIHPTNPAIVLAATTEGTFRSQNSGVTWTLVHPARMATDLIFKPGDPTTVFLAAGNSFSANPGIYRSSDVGATFTQLTAGLPSTYSGKAMLDICRDNPNIIYASIAEQLTGLGLFKSVNGGNNWTQINSTDYQTYQGWYSHDVSVNPSDADNLVTCGIDMWHSTDGGANLTQNSYWYLSDFDDTPLVVLKGLPIMYMPIFIVLFVIRKMTIPFTSLLMVACSAHSTAVFLSKDAMEAITHNSFMQTSRVLLPIHSLPLVGCKIMPQLFMREIRDGAGLLEGMDFQLQLILPTIR
ncbi:MAG: hypothetical protein IPP34_09415 [Bacteroidetes bacterium]|nr:hypothetical protein [Bacteroidota bacterium]